MHTWKKNPLLTYIRMDHFADLLDHIPASMAIEAIGGDDTYDTTPCHAQIAASGAVRSIPQCGGRDAVARQTPGAA